MPTPMKPRTKNNSPDAPNTPFRGSLAQRACEFDQTPGCCCLAGLKLPFIFFRIFSKRSSAPEKSRLVRSEEHTSELQSLMRTSYAVFCLKKKKNHTKHYTTSE